MDCSGVYVGASFAEIGGGKKNGLNGNNKDKKRHPQSLPVKNIPRRAQYSIRSGDDYWPVWRSVLYSFASRPRDYQ